MTGLVPVIHVFRLPGLLNQTPWMRGTSPRMTRGAGATVRRLSGQRDRNRKTEGTHHAPRRDDLFENLCAATNSVMTGLVPVIHVFRLPDMLNQTPWMRGTSPRLSG